MLQVAQSEAEKKLKKDDKKKELQELNELFKPVVAAQKISKGKLCFRSVIFSSVIHVLKLLMWEFPSWLSGNEPDQDL